jgi:hypothetical protein
MEEVLDRDRQGAPGPPAAPSEKVGEQAEGGSGLRAVSEAVAVVSACTLVGGGAGMLAGVALGAINPFALGLVGAVAGIVVPVFFAGVFGARGGPGGGGCSADRRQGMGENPDHDREEVPGRPAVSPENTREQAREGREQRAEEGRGDPTTRLRLFFRRLFGRR